MNEIEFLLHKNVGILHHRDQRFNIARGFFSPRYHTQASASGVAKTLSSVASSLRLNS